MNNKFELYLSHKSKHLTSKLLTSSLVSVDPSTFGLARLASLGAVMLEKQRVLSGGGPPRGCPLITTASPESTYDNKPTSKSKHKIKSSLIVLS